MLKGLILYAAVVVGTWNGNWFPSGRAEHRAHPDVESATVAASAAMLREGIDRMDPAGTNDIIICLNEMRGPKAVSNLVAAIGRKGLKVVSVSGYRRRDRFDMQQDAIATTLPVVVTEWKRWRNAGNQTPPRGYAFAALVIDPATTAGVYAVHLKSNYGATTPALAESNRGKRTEAVSQLLVAVSGRVDQVSIVAGDMNADRWRSEFANERLFALMESAGYLNVLSLLPPDARGTHPSRKYGDSALDYVFVRGLDSAALPTIEPNDGLSDHCAFFTLLTR